MISAFGKNRRTLRKAAAVLYWLSHVAAMMGPCTTTETSSEFIVVNYLCQRAEKPYHEGSLIPKRCNKIVTTQFLNFFVGSVFGSLSPGWSGDQPVWRRPIAQQYQPSPQSSFYRRH
jgi:hypothetical protein